MNVSALIAIVFGFGLLLCEAVIGEVGASEVLLYLIFIELVTMNEKG